MMNLLIYIAFLVVYVLYLWSAVMLFKKYTEKLKKGSFIIDELLILLPVVFLFAVVFIIGGFFNLYLVGLCILVSNLGMLVAFVLWSLLGSPNVPYKAVGGWAGYNAGVENPIIGIATQVVSVILMIGYPILVGIYFFRAGDAQDLSILTLQWTLIMILAYYVAFVPTTLGVISSSYIDEGSRARFLIAQFSGLIPNAIFISILFWIFNKEKAREQGINFGDVYFNFDPLLFVVLMGFLVLFLLLPYIIGVQRAKQLRESLLEKKEEILDEAVEALSLANPKNISQKLNSMLDMLADKYGEIRDDYPVMRTADQLDKTEAATYKGDSLIIYQSYKLGRPYDQRFAYNDFIDDVYAKIEELKNAVANEQDPAVIREVAEQYSEYFKDEKKDLATAAEKAGKARPALWVAIIAVVSAIASPVLAEFAKYLIEYFKAV